MHRAYDRDRQTEVALKTFLRPGAEGVYRLKKEFRALADLSHPNLVRLGELVSEGDRWFFTMEIVEGQDLLSWCRGDSGTCDETRLGAAMGQLAQGLMVIHDAGKVHRDIKPSNVMVERGTERVVILDFGLVTHDVTGGHGPGSTFDHRLVGTVAYMAPEQAASQPVGPPADWYSAGAILYEALTGSPPFQGSPLSVMTKKQRELPALPDAMGARVSPELGQLCMRMLSIDAAARPTGPGDPRGVHARPRGDAPTERPQRGRRCLRRPSGRARCAVADLRGHTAGTRSHRHGGGHRRHRQDGPRATGHQADPERARGRRDPERPLPRTRGHSVQGPRRRDRLAVASLDPHGNRRPGRAAAACTTSHAPVFPPWAASRPWRARRALPPRGSIPASCAPGPSWRFASCFARLVERWPVVVVIDDLQWADADSLALLSELVREPSAPPLLLVCIHRQDTGEAPEVSSAAQRIELDRLPEPEARELAGKLAVLLKLPVDPGAVAIEARGNPLFIDELVRSGSAKGAFLSPRTPSSPVSPPSSRARGTWRWFSPWPRAPSPPRWPRAAANVSVAELHAFMPALRETRLARVTSARGGYPCGTVSRSRPSHHGRPHAGRPAPPGSRTPGAGARDPRRRLARGPHGALARRGRSRTSGRVRRDIRPASRRSSGLRQVGGALRRGPGHRHPRRGQAP